MVTPEVHNSIDVESLLAQAHRAKDLLVGARALLSGTSTPMVPTACNLVFESAAQLDGVLHALESLAAVQHEAKRVELAHRNEQASIHATGVQVSR